MNSRKDRIDRIGVASARHADKAANGYRWRGARTDYIDIDSPHGGRFKATGLYNALPGACRHIAASSCAGGSIDAGP